MLLLVDRDVLLLDVPVLLLSLRVPLLLLLLDLLLLLLDLLPDLLELLVSPSILTSKPINFSLYSISRAQSTVRSLSCLRCRATVLVRPRPRREGEESPDDDSLRSVPRNVFPASNINGRWV